MSNDKSNHNKEKPQIYSPCEGIEVLYQYDDSYPLVSARLMTKAGEIYSKPDKMGLAGFVTPLLQEGTENKNAEEIALFIDKIGAQTYNYTDEEFAVYQISSLEEYAEDILSILSEIFTKPIFSDSEIEIARNRKLDNIKHLNTQAEYLMRKNLRKNIFGKHPYYFYQIESATLNEINKIDIVNFYNDNYFSGKSLLVLMGSLPFDDIKKLIDKYFGSWKSNKEIKINIPKITNPKKTDIYLIDRKESSQASIGIGNLGFDLRNKDYFSYRVGNRILGGNVVGRLFKRLREELGFTYGASSALNYNLNGAYWSANMNVNKMNIIETIDETFSIINDLRSGNISDIEMEKAIQSIIGEYQLSFENPETPLQLLITQKIYGLQDDYFDKYIENYKNVVKENVISTINNYIKPENSVVVIVAPISDIKDKLQDFGNIIELDIL